MKKRPYRMKTRAESASATKARILACAEELARTNLFDSTTLEAVAERAGTTVRTVLRIFSSKELLFAAALDSIGFRMIGPPHQADIDANLRVLYDFYEKYGDMVIRWLADELRVKAISEHLSIGRRNLRNWVGKAFASALLRQSVAERRELLQALIVTLDVYTWKLLRRDSGLGRNAAEAVIRRMLSGLLQE